MQQLPSAIRHYFVNTSSKNEAVWMDDTSDLSNGWKSLDPLRVANLGFTDLFIHVAIYQLTPSSKKILGVSWQSMNK